jgi:hypothetical protein
VKDPTAEHTRLQEELIAERNRLCSYILKGAKHRCKLIRQGTSNRALMAEIAITAVFLRPDLAENLIERGKKLCEIEESLGKLDRIEYAERFGTDG